MIKDIGTFLLCLEVAALIYAGFIIVRQLRRRKVLKAEKAWIDAERAVLQNWWRTYLMHENRHPGDPKLRMLAATYTHRGEAFDAVVDRYNRRLIRWGMMRERDRVAYEERQRSKAEANG